MLRLQFSRRMHELCLAAILATVGATSHAANDPAQFWFSTSSVSTAGPSAPILQLGKDQTANIFLWAQPGTDSAGDFKNLRNISLDIVSSAATFDIVDNFTVYNPQDSRFEIVRDSLSSPFSVNSQLSLAEAQAGPGDGVKGLTAGVVRPTIFSGLGVDLGDNQCTPGQACPAAWLLATFELKGVAETGVSEVRLQIGELGLNHAGESSAEASVVFGGSSNYVYSGSNDYRQGTFGIEILSGPSGIDPADLIIDADVSLPGDFNGDGRVNLADYTRWRDHLGGPEGTSVNDPHDEPIGQAQYATWRANFGATAPPAGSLATATVPEPSTVVLGMLLALAMACRHRIDSREGICDSPI